MQCRCVFIRVFLFRCHYAVLFRVCESFLRALGGHVAYDGMLGVVIMINIALSVHSDDGKSEEQKKLS